MPEHSPKPMHTTRRGMLGLLLAGLMAPWQGIARAWKAEPEVFCLHKSLRVERFRLIQGSNRSGATNFAAAEYAERLLRLATGPIENLEAAGFRGFEGLLEGKGTDSE